jgi:hypothetical protein
MHCKVVVYRSTRADAGMIPLGQSNPNLAANAV